MSKTEAQQGDVLHGRGAVPVHKQRSHTHNMRLNARENLTLESTTGAEKCMQRNM